MSLSEEALHVVQEAIEVLTDVAPSVRPAILETASV